MERDKGHTYEFADFRLIPAEGLLLRNGSPIPLSPKAFSTLVLLVEQHGHLVDKSELIDRIWQNTFVEEAAVSRCVWKIRNALCEDSQKKEFIQTVPKRGYRFVADVSTIGAEEKSAIRDSTDSSQLPAVSNGNGSSAASECDKLKLSGNKIITTLPENNDENGYNGKMPPSARFLPAEHTSVLSVNPHVAQIKPVKRSRKLFLLAGLALVLVSSLGFYFLTTGRTTSGGGDKKRIAVLPLKPINTESRDDIYEVGIADSLIYKLSSMKGLVVRPLSAVRKYKDLEQDPLAAGREQQVDYILESSYQLAGGHIRVTSRLFNVASGQIEETYKSEKDAANVFAMQDAIAGQVGNFLLARFAATSSSPMARRGTNNVEAYRLYLQGMYLYGKRTPKASKKAVELLDQAVRLDPNYALAWAGKAHAHRYRGNLGRDTNTYVEYQNSAVALNEALLLDKDLSEAYSALCENKYYYEWDFAGAERECKRAIELDPNSSMAHEIYGRYLFHRGHVDEAIIELKTAIALDPTSLFNQRNLGIALYYAGRYDEAVGQFKQVIATDENFTTAYLWLRNALEMQGNYSEAFEWLMKAQKALSADEETVRLYKTAYQTSGYQGVLRAQAERFEKGNSHFYIGAILNAQIGNKNKAFEYLEKSYQRREWGMNSLLVEPHLGSLRSDPRFDELVKRIGLK